MDINENIPAVQGTSGAAKIPPFKMSEVLQDTFSEESDASQGILGILSNPQPQEKIRSSMGISSEQTEEKTKTVLEMSSKQGCSV